MQIVNIRFSDEAWDRILKAAELENAADKDMNWQAVDIVATGAILLADKIIERKSQKEATPCK